MENPPSNSRHGSNNAERIAKKPAIQTEPGVLRPLARGQKLGNTMHSLGFRIHFDYFRRVPR
jgi:hypothetical protein